MKKLFGSLIGLLSLINVYSQDTLKCASWDLNGDSIKDIKFCVNYKTQEIKEIYYYPSGDTLKYFNKDARGDLLKRVEFEDKLNKNGKIITIKKEYIPKY
jgi:hypothetical protein